METDAAIAEAEILPTEIEQAEQDAPEPEQGETSEAVETPETEEKKAEESSGEETPEQVAEEKQKKRNSVQERISQLARQKNEANTRVQELEQQVAYLQAQSQPQAQDAPQAYPRLEDYDYDEARHQQAVLQYTSNLNAQNVQQVMQQQQQAQIAQLQAQKAQIASQEFIEKSNAFALDYKDFNETVTNPNFHQSDQVARTIVELPNGPDVAYYLGKNLKIANALNAKSDRDARDDLIRISTALQVNSRKRRANTTNAPAPSKTVTPKGRVSKDPDKMTPKEYQRYRGYIK